MSENPLSPEQQKKLLEISKLKPEEQQLKFSEFVKTLSEEQVEFLKNRMDRFLCVVLQDVRFNRDR